MWMKERKSSILIRFIHSNFGFWISNLDLFLFTFYTSKENDCLWIVRWSIKVFVSYLFVFACKVKKNCLGKFERAARKRNDTNINIRKIHKKRKFKKKTSKINKKNGRNLGDTSCDFNLQFWQSNRKHEREKCVKTSKICNS